MNRINRSLYSYLLILIAGAFLFIPLSGSVPLFDWDEINFAEVAREMTATGDYMTVQIDYKPFWEKPPLFFWMQALSMKFFGINETAARFPNAVCGILTLLFIFLIGKKILNEKFGWLWVLTYAGSMLPFFYFRSGILDPWFNLFIFAGLYFFIHFTGEDNTLRKNRLICFSALFTGFAMLTKGPVALLILFLCMICFFILKREKITLTFRQILYFFLIIFLVGGMWFIILLLTGKSYIIADFIHYHVRLFQTRDAGHGGFFLYHPVVLFFGVFPASVFALPRLFGSKGETPYHRHFTLWMIILFWIVLILFTIVRTKIVHYSSLCYFPLTFLAASGIYSSLQKQSFKKWILYFVLIIGMIVGLIVALLPFIARNIETATRYLSDPFTLANLRADVFWSGAESFIGIVLISGVIAAFFLWRRKKLIAGICVCFGSAMLFTWLSMVFIVPKIEQYSQHAAIKFYTDHAQEDCYIQPLGFKTYAHLFYGMKKKPENPDSYNEEWLLSGKIDKPAYFVCKNNKAQEYLNDHPELIKLYEKNGFVFMRRKNTTESQ